MRIATAVILLFPKLTMKNLSICLIFPITSHRQKHLTINNCDKTLLKIILRFKKIAKKERRRFDVS